MEKMTSFLTKAMEQAGNGIVISGHALYKSYAEYLFTTLGSRNGFGMTQWTNLVALMRDTANKLDFDELQAPLATMAPVESEAALQEMVRKLVRDSNGDKLAAVFLSDRVATLALDKGIGSGDPIVVLGLQPDEALPFGQYFLCGYGINDHRVVNVSEFLDTENDPDDFSAMLGVDFEGIEEAEVEAEPLAEIDSAAEMKEGVVVKDVVQDVEVKMKRKYTKKPKQDKES